MTPASHHAIGWRHVTFSQCNERSIRAATLVTSGPSSSINKHATGRPRRVRAFVNQRKPRDGLAGQGDARFCAVQDGWNGHTPKGEGNC